MTRFALVCSLLALLPGPTMTVQAQTPAPSCTAAQHRQFDFWIGEWDVLNPKGKLVGRNSITRVYGNCVIREDYKGGQGYTGGSFNIYDASRDRWHQTWVDNGGLLLELDGGFRDGSGHLAAWDITDLLSCSVWSIIRGAEGLMQRRCQSLEKRSRHGARRVRQQKRKVSKQGRRTFDGTCGDLSENLHCRAECREKRDNADRVPCVLPSGTRIPARKLSLSLA